MQTDRVLTECVFVAILLPLTSPRQTCGSFCQPRLTPLCSYCLPFVSPLFPSFPPVFVPALSHSLLQVFYPFSPRPISPVYTPSIPSTSYVFFSSAFLCTAANLSSICINYTRHSHLGTQNHYFFPVGTGGAKYCRLPLPAKKEPVIIYLDYTVITPHSNTTKAAFNTCRCSKLT